MKKWIVFLGVFACFMWIPIEAKYEVPKFKLYMDSHRDDTYQVKEEILSLAFALCDGVEEESYATILKEHKEVFTKIENSEVKWKNNTLIVTVGDGKGTLIKGRFENRESTCFEEVKPKSKIAEIFGLD